MQTARIVPNVTQLLATSHMTVVLIVTALRTRNPKEKIYSVATIARHRLREPEADKSNP
jgi:hypothetical protein